MFGGYQPITPIQLGNLLNAYLQGRLSWQGVRIALACVEMLAIREAAQKRRPKWKKNRVSVNHFKRDELTCLTGLTLRAVTRGLGQLQRAGVVEFSPQQIEINPQTQFEAVKLIEDLACGRGMRRLIPVPRSGLRFLAKESSSTLGRVMIAYWVRGLSLSKSTPEVGARGTVKACWIANNFGLSLRAVKYAQARLREINWIGKDIGSKQWKLNRDGAYFQINLDWQMPRSVKRDNPDREFAPPPTEKCTAVAPPIEDKFTPSENKNQITFKGAGVLKQGRGKLAKPTILNIRREDLFDEERLRCLFDQAVNRKLVKNCEAARLNFYAAAVRARQARGSVEKIFSGIVRRKLWQHITLDQENIARKWLQKVVPTKTASVGLEPARSVVSAILGGISTSNAQQCRAIRMKVPDADTGTLGMLRR